MAISAKDGSITSFAEIAIFVVSLTRYFTGLFCIAKN